jgi:hypothetical protein
MLSFKMGLRYFNLQVFLVMNPLHLNNSGLCYINFSMSSLGLLLEPQKPLLNSGNDLEPMLL